MWEWITSNAKVLSLFGTGLTLIVWTVYGQLMNANMRHAKTPRLTIEKNAARGLEAICLVTNMSFESIYVQGVAVSLHTKDQTYRYMLADSPKATNHGAASRRDTCQGPLRPSETVNLGTFQSLLNEASAGTRIDTRDDGALPPPGLEAITVTIVASFGPKQHTVGARRRFAMNASETPQLRSENPLTEPLQGLHKARPLRQLLKEFNDVES